MDEANVIIIDFQIGQKVAVVAESRRGSISARGEVSYVGTHHFRVECAEPIAPNSLKPNQEVKVSLADKKEVLPVTTHFVRVLDKDPQTLILKIPTGKWQQNRRAFFRGDMVKKAVVLKSDGTRLHGQTVNVSGGGALVALDEALALQEEIQVVIEFDKNETISAKARVMRIEKVNNRELYGLKFLDLSNRNQNYICRIVLIEELENRRNEIRELIGRNGNR